MYLIFLERFRENVAAAIRAVANAPDGGVVIHCVGGKDRTGLLSAFLLHLAGVDDEQIAADYALSEERLRPRHEAWFEAAESEEELERLRRIAQTPAASMAGVFSELERRYGGVEAYLREAGVTDEELELVARASVAELVVGLFGPTASGKSDVAAALAELLPAEVVSADAMQVYDGLPILTNRSPHPERLVGIWPLSHDGVGRRVRAARARGDRRDPRRRQDAARRRRDRPLLPRRARRARASAGAGARRARALGADLRRGGADAAHARLAELDPAAAARIHPNDRRRVVRALELAEAGAIARAAARDSLFGGAWRHPTLLVGLDVPEARARAADRGTNEAHVRARRRGRGARRRSAPSRRPTAGKIIGLARGRRRCRARRRSRR